MIKVIIRVSNQAAIWEGMGCTDEWEYRLQKERWREYMDILVNGKLKRGRKEMYPDFISQISLWALDDVTVRERAKWKERGRYKIRREKKRETNIHV